jgi:outer membrane protein assembly factor BamB/tetratricopeptide (TPR) repeat protein
MPRNRCILALGCLCLIGLGCVVDLPRRAQARQDPQGSVSAEDSTQPFTLPTDRTAIRKLKTAQEYIESQSWTEALAILQSMIDAKEDAFVSSEDKPAPSTKSARGEAERVLSGLSPKGFEAYQLIYGNAAAEKLKKARANHDQTATEEIVRRWFHTRAGFDAGRDLAVAHLDRGEPESASRHFAALMHHHLADKLTGHELYQAALAFHLADNHDGETLAWTTLEKKHKGKALEMPGRSPKSITDLQKEVQEVRATASGRDDWRVFRGNAARADNARGGAPLLEPSFRAATFSHPATKDMFYRAVAHLDQHDEPILPTFFPIAVGDKLVYRSCEGIHAVDLNTLAPAWKKPAELRLSLDKLLGNFNSRYQIYEKLDAYGRGTVWYGWWWHYANDWQAIFENSTIGTLSSDGARVFAVDDLPIPPHPSMHTENEQRTQQGMPPAYTFGTLADDVQHNRLRAFNVETGELLWELGGKTPPSAKAPRSVLHDSFFLGPPLPLGGKLYVLNDHNGEVRLVCLKPATGEVLWLQPLSSTPEPITMDVGRRLRALHIAHADGVLVCPTGTGALVAVDALSHNLLWSYAYGSSDERTADVGENGALSYGWKTSAPLIHQGRVLFAGCDCDHLCCLNLRDGSPGWKDPELQVERETLDRFLGAAYKDHILVVQRNGCRLVDLKTGDETRKLHTGRISGQGVQDGKHYYLPLKSGSIAVIDLESGKVSTSIRNRTSLVPGNLIFHQGKLISQNLHSIAVFPQLEARLAEINDKLKARPADPVLLTERGIFLLDKGDLMPAINDLRAALGRPFPKGEEKVRDKAGRNLFDALTRLLQEDFPANEKLLDEYRELAAMDSGGVSHDERRRRHIQLARIVAIGREQQQRFTDALAAYEELFKNCGDDDEPMAFDDDAVEIVPRAWVIERVSGLFESGKDRAQLEKSVTQRWHALGSTATLEGLEGFASLYGNLKAGFPARLELAERLIAKPEFDRGLQAEQLLLALLRNQQATDLHPRALEMLARLMTRKGLVEDAVFYYRRLARNFPKAQVCDGKTAGEFLETLQFDKRFQPYLTDSPPDWTRGKYKVTEITGNFSGSNFTLMPEGEVCPSLRHLRVILDILAGGVVRLRLRDLHNDQDVWSAKLSLTADEVLAVTQMTNSVSRIPFQLKGHLAVANLGSVVIGVNLMDRRMLWHRTIVHPSSADDLEGAGSVGQTGPVDSPYVCLQTRRDFQVADALTGRLLWRRVDFAVQISMFGDDRHVYTVEMPARESSGTTMHGRCLRLSDGAEVTTPDFARLFLHSQSTAYGGTLLIQDTSESGSPILRLYDVHTGKNDWSIPFPSGSILLNSSIDGLSGYVAPRGELTILDVKTKKTLLSTKLEKAHLEKVNQTALFGDETNFYLALSAPSDDQRLMGEPAANWLGTEDNVPVNGYLYAFSRKTGKLAWFHALEHQFLLLDQQEDLPILFASSNLVRKAGPGQIRFTTTCAIDKRTGKQIYRHEYPNNGSDQPYCSIHFDRGTGTVELVSPTHKLRLAPETK